VTLPIARLPDLIREARIRTNVTQKQLARLSGVSQTSISRYEEGQRVPTTAQAEAMLTALGYRLTISIAE
jgi:transcriptional regulator with XRE-family HTH domain